MPDYSDMESIEALKKMKKIFSEIASGIPTFIYIIF